ncbi:hypothetical protein QFC22_000086 [Naganishia vaughanmartiniae]|uniref:Uncharacterized protein n=1 Tax=Naganishia vaughanmartiniae TaxID=1424756 RepID=A0ACC2XR02_9TREE|nr:hypothetical protein QFC22_000086 [Naganishia vaughanmartiniae]
MNNLFHHPTLSNVLAKATFPPDNQLAHVVNGQRNKLLLSLANTGKENYTLLSAAASYHDPAQHWALELGLTVWANLRDAAGGVHRVVAYNETVTVVEPVGSLFDVQALFMYLILAAAIAGLSYLAYETLSARYFPSLSGKPTTGRKSTTTTSTVKGTSSGKVLVATDGKGKGGYPASVQPYEEEWIPEHLTRKSGGAVKRKTTTTATVAGEGAVSAGEMTSGGEGEKKKLGAGKGKGKGRK